MTHHTEQRVTWAQRMELWFPEREFFMRSHGQVRFIKISSKLQKRTAALALTASVAFVGSMGVMSVLQYRSSVERVALLEREADVATSEERLKAYRANIGEVTQDLEKRQDFIEGMIEMLPPDAVKHDNVTDSANETDELVEKVSAAVPEAASLARIESRQLAFVEGLTRYADQRSRRAMWALRELGLDPDRMPQCQPRQRAGNRSNAVAATAALSTTTKTALPVPDMRGLPNSFSQSNTSATSGTCESTTASQLLSALATISATFPDRERADILVRG